MLPFLLIVQAGLFVLLYLLKKNIDGVIQNVDVLRGYLTQVQEQANENREALIETMRDLTRQDRTLGRIHTDLERRVATLETELQHERSLRQIRNQESSFRALLPPRSASASRSASARQDSIDSALSGAVLVPDDQIIAALWGNLPAEAKPSEAPKAPKPIPLMRQVLDDE